MEETEHAVLAAVARVAEKRRISLTDRLVEDLWLDDMETAKIAIELQSELGRRPSTQAYSQALTVGDLVMAFHEAPPLSEPSSKHLKRRAQLILPGLYVVFAAFGWIDFVNTNHDG